MRIQKFLFSLNEEVVNKKWKRREIMNNRQKIYLSFIFGLLTISCVGIFQSKLEKEVQLLREREISLEWKTLWDKVIKVLEGNLGYFIMGWEKEKGIIRARKTLNTGEELRQIIKNPEREVMVEHRKHKVDWRRGVIKLKVRLEPLSEKVTKMGLEVKITGFGMPYLVMRDGSRYESDLAPVPYQCTSNGKIEKEIWESLAKIISEEESEE
jgi:hypothetical protein